MRRVLTAAVSVVLATAALAGAAPARGLTFTDPVGDANGLDGRTDVGSQPHLDVVRVTLSQAARTKKTAGLAVRIDLAAPVSADPGTTYYVTGTQGACDFRVDLAMGTDGWAGEYTRSCVSGTLDTGGYSGGSLRLAPPRGGRSVTIVVPASVLPDSRIGARITGIHAGSAISEPALHTVAVHPDVASHPGPYVVGS